MTTMLFEKFNDSLDLRHNRAVPSTVVKESTIEGAGKGLFADQDIKYGEHMGWYFGIMYSEHPMNGSEYILCVTRMPPWSCSEIWAASERKAYIDGDPNPYGLNKWVRLSMINHTDTKSQENVRYLENGRVVTTKYIKKGTELLANYGDDYF